MKKWSRNFLLVVFCCCLAGCATDSTVEKPNLQEQADALRHLGEAYLMEQNYTMALSKLIEAEKISSDDHLLFQDLGFAYMGKNETQTAIGYFKKALEIKPDYAMARNNLGAAYLALEDWDSAIECFLLLTKDLLYATPHYPLANLGRAYYEKKAFSEAEKYYQEALALEPDFASALYGLGRTYMATGKVNKAAECFEHATKAAPDIVDIQFESAEAHRLIGDTAAAREGYQRVIELDPDSELAKESKQELIYLK